MLNFSCLKAHFALALESTKREDGVKSCLSKHLTWQIHVTLVFLGMLEPERVMVGA